MRAFIFERNGEPADVLAVRDLPDPVPGPGELLVRVSLSPVNASDLHVIRGRFGRQPALPASPGLECVGVVQTLGPGTQGPVPGTCVWRIANFDRRSRWGTSGILEEVASAISRSSLTSSSRFVLCL